MHRYRVPFSTLVYNGTEEKKIPVQEERKEVILISSFFMTHLHLVNGKKSINSTLYVQDSIAWLIDWLKHWIKKTISSTLYVQDLIDWLIDWLIEMLNQKNERMKNNKDELHYFITFNVDIITRLIMSHATSIPSSCDAGAQKFGNHFPTHWTSRSPMSRWKILRTNGSVILAGMGGGGSSIFYAVCVSARLPEQTNFPECFPWWRGHIVHIRKFPPASPGELRVTRVSFICVCNKGVLKESTFTQFKL